MSHALEIADARAAYKELEDRQRLLRESLIRMIIEDSPYRLGQVVRDARGDEFKITLITVSYPQSPTSSPSLIGAKRLKGGGWGTGRRNIGTWPRKPEVIEQPNEKGSI